MAEEVHEEAEQAGARPKPTLKKRSRFAGFLVVVVLLAAAFGAGLLLGSLQSRGAREAWLKEKADLQASSSALSKDVDAARSQAFLWRLAEGVAQVRVDLAEKNYGLARDAAASARGLFDAAPELAPEVRAQVSALGPMLADIQSAADSLAPDARSKANDAADFLKRLLESSGAASGSAAAQTPQDGGGTRSP